MSNCDDLCKMVDRWREFWDYYMNSSESTQDNLRTEAKEILAEMEKFSSAKGEIV